MVAASATPPQRKQPGAQEAEHESEAAPLPFGPPAAVAASVSQAAAGRRQEAAAQRQPGCDSQAVGFRPRLRRGASQHLVRQLAAGFRRSLLAG